MKLKANDLRIGNYIKSNNGIYKVAIISNPDCIIEQVMGGCIESHIDLLTPIPLDADLLVKCGFVFADEDRCYLPYGFMPRAGFKIELGKHTDLKHETYWHIYCANYPVDIYYLHQLQNLYYALTAQELPVTL